MGKGADHLGFPRKLCQMREEMKGKKLPEFPRQIGGLAAPFEQEKWRRRGDAAAAIVAREFSDDGEKETEGDGTTLGRIFIS
ncbi:hypothetical protein AAC387_Pa06g1698 [Persea americana]